MIYKVLTIVLLINNLSAKYISRFHQELDDEDLHLLRSAYDTPSYDADQQEEHDDLGHGKLDLLKDGEWAVKAKVKELLAFEKALIANMKATKLKLKDLIENHLDAITNHHHPAPAKKKPTYPQYQIPVYGEYGPQYGQQYAQRPVRHDPYYGQ